MGVTSVTKTLHRVIVAMSQETVTIGLIIRNYDIIDYPSDMSINY